jgi:glycosyltransferase involved in cell wall biosynthesis
MNRPTVSAAIIALNEERHLTALLPRLAWADEIVVIDGGSHDATVEIARRHGCRVMVHAFDNYARQRNRAIALATGDWVLSIDADERPTPGFATELARRLPKTRAGAFRVPIRSAIFGRRFRFSGTQDDCPVRLFRRGTSRWTGHVHEVLEFDGPLGRLEHWLDHETLPDLPSFLAKMNRYTTLAAESRCKSGQRPRWTDLWLAPVRETMRRLIWKHGWLDGPEGWAFCLLSGFSEWVLARKLRAAARTQTLSRDPQGSPPARGIITQRAPLRVAVKRSLPAMGLKQLET